MDLLKPCEKGTRLNSWENYYIQKSQAKGQLLEEQCTQEVSALYRLVQAYAPSNGTSRLDGTAHHANTYVGVVTNSSVLKVDAK